MNIKVTKASGVLEPFSEAKIRRSLKRAGAQPQVIDKILVQLIGRLHDGLTTRQIYRQVFDLLNQYQAGQGYHYSLKDALMQLGPSGYPFEKYISRLLTHLGYRTQTQVIVKGKCLDHEVDVVAAKDNQQFLIECKFHNRAGTKTRSKDALYVQARFEDIKETGSGYQQMWLVTNTKLTSNTIKYGLCRGIKLLAWRYPAANGLESLIEANKFHPLSCLTFLNQDDCRRLYQNNLLLCRDLARLKKQELINLGLNSTAITQILDFFSLPNNIFI